MLRFELIQDLDSAKKWWLYFAETPSLYLDWDFRYCFYKPSGHKIYFYLGYDGDQPVGLLPLEWNEKGYLQFFGGTYMKKNQIFIKSGFESFVPEFYKNITLPLKLEWMSGYDTFTQNFEIQEYDYFLSIKEFNSFDDYKAVAPSRVERKIRKMRQLNREYKIDVLQNNFEDIELLFRLNIESYKQDSAFLYQFRQEGFHNFLELPFDITVFTFVINGEKKGVSLGCLYKGDYMYLTLGFDAENGPPDLSSYIHLTNFEHAIKMKAKSIDVLAVNCGWKELWGLQKVPQYKFSQLV